MRSRVRAALIAPVLLACISCFPIDGVPFARLDGQRYDILCRSVPERSLGDPVSDVEVSDDAEARQIAGVDVTDAFALSNVISSGATAYCSEQPDRWLIAVNSAIPRSRSDEIIESASRPM